MYDVNVYLNTPKGVFRYTFTLTPLWGVKVRWGPQCTIGGVYLLRSEINGTLDYIDVQSNAPYISERRKYTIVVSRDYCAASYA